MSTLQAVDSSYVELYSPAVQLNNQVENSIREIVAIRLFQLASYLTDPICKSHECFRRIQVVDTLQAQDYKIVNLARKVLLAVALTLYGCMAVFTTAPAVGVRSLAIYLQKEPVHLHK